MNPPDASSRCNTHAPDIPGSRTRRLTIPPAAGLSPTPRGAPKFIAACGRQSLLAGIGLGRLITIFDTSLLSNRQSLGDRTSHRIIDLDESLHIPHRPLAVPERQHLLDALFFWPTQ